MKTKKSTHSANFLALRQFLIANAGVIEDEATNQHIKVVGNDNLRRRFLEKYRQDHLEIVKQIAKYLVEPDIKEGIVHFNKLAEELAKKSVRDRLTLEEAVNGSIFLKQAIWKKIEEAKLLETLTVEELHQVNQRIGTFIDAVGSKLAFTFHEHFKKAEEEQFTLAAIVNSSEVAIISKTLEGIISSWNNAAEKLYGYTAKEAIGKPITIVIPKDRLHEEKKIISSIKKGVPVEHLETERLRKDGSKVYISLTVSPVKDSEGNIIGASKIARDITKQKTFEKELTQREDRFRSLIENSADAIAMVDEKGKFIYVSPSVVRVLGYTEKELIGRDTLFLFPQGHLETVKEQFAPVFRKDGAMVTVEHMYVHKNGSIGWLESKITNLLKKPAINALVANFRDITERKEIEERQKFLETIGNKLVASFDREMTLQEIGKIVVSYLADYCRIAIVDENQEIKEISVNHTDPTKVSLAEDLYENYKNSPASTHGVGRILQSGKSEIIETIDAKVLATAQNNPKLVKIIKQIGLKSYMGVPLIARGKVIGAMTLSSVQEHRYYSKKDLRFAEELAHRIALALDNMRLFKEAQAELREREQAELNLKYLAEATKILTSSLDYKTTLANIAKLAVPKIADWCAIDLLDGKGGIEQVSVAHKDPDKIKWAKEIRKADPPDVNAPSGVPNVIRTGKSEYFPEIPDEMLVKVAKDKKHLKMLRDIGFTSAIVTPLKREGKGIGAITFVTTETKRHFTQSDLAMAEELANRASVALENAGLYQASQDAIIIRDNFISVASHELKTPVTSVKIFTEVMQHHSRQIGDTKALDHLSKMNRQLDKLTDLIYNMLNISKIQAGRLEFNQKLYDFDASVQEIVEVLQEGTKKHRIVIEGETKKKVFADEDRIGQVLSNLIANALKYSPKSDKVVIRLQVDDNNVIVCVEDFGIGMAKVHLDKIFERFYRVFDTNDKTFPGLGIGLYISSEIIRRHHGKLWVESNTGKGSKFYFSLPLTRDKKPNGVQVL